MKRFDQIVLACICLLTCLVALTWGFGDRPPIRVEQFSWEGKQIGVTDQSFRLAFNQRIEPERVLKNLTLDPPLAGKLSWIGKTFFYTLSDRPIYGQEYQLKLAVPTTSQKPTLEPFISRFKTRDRAFAYIGTDGTDRGRLILYNLTQQKKTVLTPADLIVLNFDAYPDGDRLLFSAIAKGSANTTLGDQQLYSVTTGLNYQGTGAIAAGKLKTILDAKQYQNGKFQLADNGQRIIIQRTNRENPRDQSLWVIEGQGEPRALGIPAEEFLLAPDAETLAVSQQNKLSLVPLGRNSGAIQAQEKYSRILAFSPDQTRQIALQSHDGTNTLYLLDKTAKEPEKRLVETRTPVVECQFEPRYEEMLYCLKIDQGDSLGQPKNEPFLSAINLQTGAETPLLALPNYSDVRLSISVDGLALLFDQVVTAEPTPTTDLFTNNGLAVEGGRLWLLALPELKAGGQTIQPVPPESLMPGYKPQWMP